MQKSKSKTSTSLTPIETALQQQFKPDASRLDSLIREAYERTAKTQAANMAAMVGFGLLALAIKPIVGHGKFGDWLKSALGGQMGKSTAYKWIEGAKYLIAKIETAERQSDIIAERICDFVSATGIKGGAEEIFADAKISSAFISLVSANLPFSTFLNIMKTANANAIELEATEAKSQTALRKSDLRGLNGGVDESGQANFFDELFEEVRATVEVKFDNDNRILTLSKDQLLELGNYLKDRAAKILSLAKEKKD